jgi:hypothetical protein
MRYAGSVDNPDDLKFDVARVQAIQQATRT